MVPRARALLVAVATSLPALAPGTASGQGSPELKVPFCQGAYADDQAVLSPEARARAQGSEAGFSYCVRSRAVYECLSYGADGAILRTEKVAVAHGTAFAYRRDGAATLLATNQHVAEWPLVTSGEHPVEDVPEGCKRVASNLRIVDDELDGFEDDDIPLSVAVADPRLDVAVVRSEVPLTVMPWKIGRSSGLRERNVVEVHGFPLGAFRATSLGKVISVYDHDTYRDWDHDDFVIDALLSAGTSGSPVLAVSCETGAYELVGIYHAGYARGAALNVVVAIDQVRELLETLTASSAKPHVETFTLDPAGRAHLSELVEVRKAVFFPFGKLTATVRNGACGALVFEVFSPEFPVEVHPIALVEDLAPKSADRFGEPGRICLGRREGLKEWTVEALSAADRQAAERLLDALRRASLAACTYRVAALEAHASREKAENASRLAQQLRRLATANRGIAQTAVSLAGRLAPEWSEAEPFDRVLERLTDRPDCAPPEGPMPAAPPATAPASAVPPGTPPVDATAPAPRKS